MFDRNFINLFGKSLLFGMFIGIIIAFCIQWLFIKPFLHAFLQIKDIEVLGISVSGMGALLICGLSLGIPMGLIIAVIIQRKMMGKHTKMA